MWTYNYSNELYHHGIPGMKWGVRRSKAQLSRAGGKTKSKVDDRSDDAKEADKIGKKKVGQMSNTELRKINERRNLEQNYSRLNPSTVKKGLAVAATAAAAMGTMAALHTNGSKLVDVGRQVAPKVRDAIDMAYAKHLGVY